MAPDFLNAFYSNSSVFNPAFHTPNDGPRYDIAVNSRTGIFNDVFHFQGSATLPRLYKRSATQNQGFGLDFNYGQQGPFIRNSRLYGRYYISQSLNRSLNLVAGASFGFYGFFIVPSNTSPGYTVSMADGNFGVGLKNAKGGIWVSANQLFDNERELATSEFYLKRTFHFFGTYTIAKRKSELTFYNWVRDFEDPSIALHTEFNYRKLVSIATGIDTQRGNIFTLGYTHQFLKGMQTKVRASYNFFLLFAPEQPISTWEITISIF